MRLRHRFRRSRRFRSSFGRSTHVTPAGAYHFSSKIDEALPMRVHRSDLVMLVIHFTARHVGSSCAVAACTTRGRTAEFAGMVPAPKASPVRVPGPRSWTCCRAGCALAGGRGSRLTVPLSHKDPGSEMDNQPGDMPGGRCSMICLPRRHIRVGVSTLRMGVPPGRWAYHPHRLLLISDCIMGNTPFRYLRPLDALGKSQVTGSIRDHLSL
jgi:hypothetical protein